MDDILVKEEKGKSGKVGKIGQVALGRAGRQNRPYLSTAFSLSPFSFSFFFKIFYNFIYLF